MSYLANHLKEAQLFEWFGSVQGSDVPAKYVHLSGRDLVNVYDAMHGLTDTDEEEDRVQECCRCQEVNERDDQYYGSCGAPLDTETAVKQAEEQKDSEELVIQVDSESEAKLLKTIQREVRENPEEYRTSEK